MSVVDAIEPAGAKHPAQLKPSLNIPGFGMAIQENVIEKAGLFGQLHVGAGC
jgi:hypothetical protein